MRHFILAAVIGVSMLSSTGCLIPAFSGDRAERTQELIYVSEGFRHIVEEWQRFWFLDQPDHLSPYRTHGGII